MSVEPSHEPHRNLEGKVNDWLTNHDYLTSSSTYHEVMPEEVKERLKSIYTPTSLYLRTIADRIAVHQNLPFDFEWECKTHMSEKYHDLTLEALPLAHHILKSKLDVRILYVWSIPSVSLEGGFWVSDMPKIREFHIPDRWGKRTKNWFKNKIGSVFGNVRPKEIPHKKGSGDPYIIIDNSEIRKCRDWKKLILEKEKSIQSKVKP